MEKKSFYKANSGTHRKTRGGVRMGGGTDEITLSLKQIIPPNLIGAHDSGSNEKGVASSWRIVGDLTVIQVYSSPKHILCLNL